MNADASFHESDAGDVEGLGEDVIFQDEGNGGRFEALDVPL